MPGGLICEMGTFCVILVLDFWGVFCGFFQSQKILARTKSCISITLICAMIADFPGFSTTLLGCSLYLIHARDVTTMELALEQSAIRTILAEPGKNTGFCEQKSPKCRLPSHKKSL